jgi:hypothetical protein
MEKDTGTFWIVEEYKGETISEENLIYTESFLDEKAANDKYVEKCTVSPDHAVTIRRIERLLLEG